MISQPFRRVAGLVVVGVIGLGLTGCSNNSSDAATITYHDSSGEQTIHITRSEFTQQVSDLVASKPFQTLLKTGQIDVTGDQKNTTGANVAALYLSLLVEQSAWDAEFSSLDLKTSSGDRAAADLAAREQFALGDEVTQDAQGNVSWKGPGVVFNSLPKSLQSTLINRELRIAAVRRYYSQATAVQEKALYERFAKQICPSGRMVSHILVKDLATANAIETQLQNGAAFAELAKTKSTDTASAKAGGLLGCLSAGTYVKPFEDAANAAAFDVVTKPVKSEFGYHIILVTKPKYADFQGQILQALQQQGPRLLQTLQLQAMHVVISPQYGTGSLAVDQQQALRYRVTPPVVPEPRTAREKAPTTSTTTPLVGG
jgi:PPIC-type PPIASE domain